MPARITIVMDEPIGVVSPLLFGHFAEHLGCCVNDGVWVGEGSAIPNIGGLRQDVVEAWRRVGPGVLRWPGGCFADDYHWADGVGPRQGRPRTVNLWWGQEIEDNAFGTHEFLNLCRLIGAEPYLAGNVGSGTVREMRDWVEYCNYDRPSTLALRRAANGSPMPFGVKYWGVGNEAWGCGGNFCPEDYAREYRRYATYLRDLGGTELFLIACGPDGNRPEWTRKFLQKLATADRRFNCRIHGLAAHYYCGTAGCATQYTTDQWYELLHRAAGGMEQLIAEQRAAMDEFDGERRIGLIVDEWGTWHPPAPGRDPAHLWQQNTVRDALVAALTLDVFVRRCDCVVMANIAQAINVLQALFLTQGDRMILTPTYHVFELYRPHQGGRAVRVEVDSSSALAGYGAPEGLERRSMPALSGSASVRGGWLTLSVVNAHARLPVDAAIELRAAGMAAGMGGGEVRVLGSDGDIHAHNTFEEPNRVVVRRRGVWAGELGRWTFEPASVTVFQIRVG